MADPVDDLISTAARLKDSPVWVPPTIHQDGRVDTIRLAPDPKVSP